MPSASCWSYGKWTVVPFEVRTLILLVTLTLFVLTLTARELK